MVRQKLSRVSLGVDRQSMPVRGRGERGIVRVLLIVLIVADVDYVYC